MTGLLMPLHDIPGVMLPPEMNLSIPPITCLTFMYNEYVERYCSHHGEGLWDIPADLLVGLQVRCVS
jgi:hypothetical protein